MNKKIALVIALCLMVVAVITGCIYWYKSATNQSINLQEDVENSGESQKNEISGEIENNDLNSNDDTSYNINENEILNNSEPLSESSDILLNTNDNESTDINETKDNDDNKTLTVPDNKIEDNNEEYAKMYFRDVSYLEWRDKALNYYEAKNNYRPQHAMVTINLFGNLSIQLYDEMETHIATSDWYEVNKDTGVITNILGEEIDLNL